MKSRRVPSIMEVAGIIRDSWSWDHYHTTKDEGGEMDVRLVVGRVDSSWFGNWTVNIGSSDYDQWHGLCGASSFDVTCRPTWKAAIAIARDLVDQVKDQIADER